MKGFSVQLEIENAGKAERLFQALSVNGKVTMPFWPLAPPHRLVSAAVVSPPA
jgi:hypothetical protein